MSENKDESDEDEDFSAFRSPGGKKAIFSVEEQLQSSKQTYPLLLATENLGKADEDALTSGRSQAPPSLKSAIGLSVAGPFTLKFKDEELELVPEEHEEYDVSPSEDAKTLSILKKEVQTCVIDHVY